ncbi:MAG: hypothetical protein GY811_08200 [Myxococcales bacterium]|nr:hypothetical protein [Myxococcales bacterium]
MRLSLALCILLLASCSDTASPPPDARAYDAALGFDASEVLPDAAATTVCGTGKDAIECLQGLEICVKEDLGGPIIPACLPLPTGCDVRDCASCGALCEAPTDTCDDDTDDNSISCVCLTC